MYGIYTSLIGQRCVCEREFVLHTSPKGVSDDSRVYTFDAVTGMYNLYKLTDLSGLERDDLRDRTVKCLKMRTLSWAPLYDFPCFNRVGVFKLDGYHEGEPEEVMYTDIKGKVVVIDNDIGVLVPKNVLDEAT